MTNSSLNIISVDALQFMCQGCVVGLNIYVVYMKLSKQRTGEITNVETGAGGRLLLLPIWLFRRRVVRDEKWETTHHHPGKQFFLVLFEILSIHVVTMLCYEKWETSHHHPLASSIILIIILFLRTGVSIIII